MTVTEEEARKLWCPMVRYQPLPYNWIRTITQKRTSWLNTSATNTGSRCIASDCMMWRWNDKTLSPEGHFGTYTITDYTHGHCGLGGKP
jgi:hypothetical protein